MGQIISPLLEKSQVVDSQSCMLTFMPWPALGLYVFIKISTTTHSGHHVMCGKLPMRVHRVPCEEDALVR
jgi:hypothetical protein